MLHDAIAVYNFHVSRDRNAPDRLFVRIIRWPDANVNGRVLISGISFSNPGIQQDE